MSESAAQPEPFFRRLVGRPAFWVAFVGLVFCANLLRAVFATVPEPPPVLGTVPAFELTDQRGQQYGSAQLEGKIWIANFIFTRCTTVCPIFSGKMSELQKRTNKASASMQLVSFSVDPEYDTPEILAEYGKRFRANPWYWHFLTGPTDAVRTTVVEGLKTAMGSEAEAKIPEALFHGSHFVLVDQQLQLRGFYDVNDDETIDRLLVDIQMVIAQQQQTS